MKFTIVTGLSGAGRSSALKAFEDMGFFCADNIPPALIPSFVQLCINRPTPPSHVAIAVDMRMGDMFDSIYNAIEELKRLDLTPDILFLDADDETLVTRFKYTRRTHPVSGSGKIIEGILMEREKLQRIKEMADNVVDTSTYTARELGTLLGKLYKSEQDDRLLISIITFGYKRGIPLDADLVFDMRFLPNPYYRENLKSFSGLTKEVRDYVLSFEASQQFLEKLIDMVAFLAPCFMEQSKKQLVIGIGCTGGMHRSVTIGEELYGRLHSMDYRVTLEHRDMKLEMQSSSSGE